MTHHEEICPYCKGTGRIGRQSRSSASRKGGNIAYLKSKEPGQLSMRERGLRGGRPRALTIEDIKAMERERKNKSTRKARPPRNARESYRRAWEDKDRSK